MSARSSKPVVQGWCPGAHRPMMSGDGLVVRVRPRLGFVAQMKRGFPEFADRALEALLDALTKDLT